MFKYLTNLFILSLLVGLFTGCGGGGGASSSSSSTTGDGYFVDSAVQGIEYTTNSTSGVTDSSGRFTYNLTDTTITFKLGDLTIANNFNLSSLNADKKILPADLLGLDRNNTTDANLTKMLRVLQSLDSDGNPDNGIVIQTATKNLLTTTANILDSNISILNTIVTGAGKTLKSLKEAKEHYEKNLRDSFSIDVDTIEPDVPTLTTDTNQTESSSTSVEVNGEVGSKIFVDGVDTGLTIDSNGKKTISLDTNATLGNDNTFIIVLKDNKDNISSSLSITVTKVDVTAPVFTSSATVSVNENQTSALTLVATDTNTITYSISSGDSGSFDVNSSTGVVTFKSAPDYETKNSYTFTATANDGTFDTNQSVTVNINDVNENTTTELYIQSAVYDNNRTATANDDILYLYFNKQIDSGSISTDMSTNYDLNGTGALGSASVSDYNDTIFHRHKISLNSSGTASTALESNSTKISLVSNVITDVNGSYPSDLNQTLVTKFNVFGRLKTGQTTTYIEGDDGNTTRGIERSYTDNGDGTVTDNATGLIWQWAGDNTQRDWNTAVSYCSNLTLGGNSDWRIPSIEELISLIYRERALNTIDSIFINNSAFYWSFTNDISDNSNVWIVNFLNGASLVYAKTNSTYVRCVQ